MRFSRLPPTLLTLIFALNVDTTFAEPGKNDGSGETVDIFAVDYPIVAYVVDSGKHNAETTYHIACASSAATSDCNFAQPYTLIQGASTVSFEFTAPVATSTTSASSPALTQSFTLGCALASKTALTMDCKATGLVEDLDVPVTTSQEFSFTGTAAQAFFKAVTVVTKTEDLLTHTPGATSSSAKASITGEVFLEGSNFKGKAVTTGEVTSASSSVVTGIVVAEMATASATVTKSSGAGRIAGSGNGVLYTGLVMVGFFGLGML
ncbi:uncharacterized protein PAC_13177 [Phialocephala subalpina]|uniref:GPI anchored cell wall protein n=1 Tax=Phialocephala subalpina TaxID=576137 RepID=A0A1L7XE12_9HELO|nr:uncharacterized protein PAC_13177 [Phialocephala subalpina]